MTERKNPHEIIRSLGMEKMPVEGTYIASTYHSKQFIAEGIPSATTILGLYSEELESVSCFHRLRHDEIWFFLDGDPLVLYLLFEDGTTQEVVMGTDYLSGQKIQFVVPANVWQAGCIVPGGTYSLYACVVTPGFTGKCFEAGVAEDLIEKYPSREDIIKKLAVNGGTRLMPEGYAEF